MMHARKGSRFRRSPRWWCWVMLAMWCPTLVGWGQAAEPVAAQSVAKADDRGSQAQRRDNGDVLPYRRVFVPEKEPTRWPTGGEPYVPVDREQFERLVQTVEQLDQGTAPLRLARLVRARYRARLVAPLEIVGEAELEVRQRGQTPSMLWLEPWNLALEHVAWDDPERSVVCGTSADGRLAALVERSGTLRFGWSVRGSRRADGAALFVLRVPRCTSSNVELITPLDVQIEVDRGVVLSEPIQEDDQAVWAIALGGRSDLILRIVQHPSSWPDERRPLVREQFAYDISPRGLDVAASFEFDVHGRPLQRLLVDIDPGLLPIAAFYGDQRLPVSIVERVEKSLPEGKGGEVGASGNVGQKTASPTESNALQDRIGPEDVGKAISDGENAKRPLERDGHQEAVRPGLRVAIDLPTPLLGNGQTVRLMASGQVTLDRLWSLPTLRLQNVRWQQAETTVRVHAPLEVHELQPRRCTQSGMHVLPAPARGEAFVFQLFEPAASIAVRVGRRVEPLRVRRVTSLVLKPDESTGQVIADLTLAVGERFEVEATVDRSWSIDSVASIPLGAVDDWTLEPVPETESQQRLRIRLAKPVRADQPTRLIVSGRYVASALSKPLRGSALRLVRFAQAIREDDLVSVEADPRYTLEIDGIERIERVDPTALDDQQHSLLVGEPGPLLFRWNDRAEAVAVSLAAGQPAFTASITGRVLVTPHTVRQQFAMTCLPDGDALDHVVVRFSAADASPIEWRLVGESLSLRTEKLSASALERLGLLATGETWRVWLPRPMTTGFELVASCKSRRSDRHALLLVSLPLARTQRGRLIVEREGGTRLEIQNRRLTPLPREAGDLRSQFDVRGRFAYDPATDAASTLEPAIVVGRPAAAQLAPEAVIWHERIDSYVAPRNEVQHVARYWLENQGLSRLMLRWPRAAKFVSLAVEPSEAEAHGEASDLVRPMWKDDLLVVALPAGRRFVGIRLIYVTAAPRLPAARSYRFSQPEVVDDVAVLGRERVVWLPPGYEASSRGDWQGLAKAEPGLWVRWFGPLGRPATKLPFDPLRFRNWRRGWQMVWGTDEVSAAELVASLGSAVEVLQREQHAEITWRRLLIGWGEQLASLGHVLHVDAVALRRAGITAETPIGELTGNATAEQRGRDLLLGSALAVLVHGHKVTLSTPGAVASWADSLGEELNGLPLVFRVAWRHEGPFLPERAGTVVAETAALEARSVAPYAWGVVVPQAWKSDQEAVAASQTAAGWTAHRFVGGTKPLEVTIVRVSFLRWLGWCVLLATAWSVWRFLRHRLTWAVGLAIGVGLLAVWLPAAVVPLASGCLLGVLLGIGTLLVPRWLAVVWPVAESGVASSSGSQASRELVTAGMVLLVAGVAGWRGSALAEPLERKVPATIHRVLIPVDDQKQPTGDKYFVPQSFFDALRRLAGQVRGEPQGWLIERARYRVTLPGVGEAGAGEAGEATESVELVARYDVRLFSPALPLRLLLGDLPGMDAMGEQSDLSARVRLDGRPIDAMRRGARGQWELWMTEVGLHELELRVPLQVRSRNGTRWVEARIPPVARATLEVRLPDESFDVRVPSSLGPLSQLRERRRCRTNLGPTSTLQIRWKPQRAPATADRPIDVEHYYWWRIKPGSVVVDAEFRFTAPAEGLTQFEVLTHSRLRVLPSAHEDASSDRRGNGRVEVETVAGDPQRLRFRFEEPRRGETRLRVSMLLPEASGVAHLRFPRIETPGAHTTRRWLAVWVDPALQYEWMSADRATELDIEEYLRAWGRADERPQMAFRLDEKGWEWEIATRPVPQRKTARQQIWVRCGSDRTDLRLVARIEPHAGSSFQHRLQVPAHMTIEEVLVVEEDVQNAVRWHHDRQGRLTLFLSGRAARPQRVEVRGFVPHRLGQHFRLTAFDVLDADVESTEVALLRDPNVRVQVVALSGLVAKQSAAGMTEASDAFRSRPVATYRATTMDYGLTLQVRRNAPATRGVQIIGLRRQDDVWQAQLDLHLEIEKGQIELLHIDVPSNWSGPFVVSPEAEYRLVELPGRAARRLVVWPRESIDRSLHLIVRGPLAFEPGQRVRLPHVAVRGMEALRRFVVLPTQNGSEPMAWDTRALRRVDQLPVAYATASTSSQAIYRVIGEHGEATLRSSDGSAGHPQVWLADIRVACNVEGHLCGVVSYDLEPSGVRSCKLRVPEAGRLAEVRVNGLPALVSRLDEHTWNVQLEATELPQFIEVAFETETDLTRRARVMVPSLEGLPVERTIWTFAGPLGWGRPTTDAEPIGPLALERIAANNIAELITHGVELSSQPAEELVRWYTAYNTRLRASLARLEGWLPSGVEVERRNALADLAAIREEQQRLGEQLHAVVADDEPGASSLIDLWLASMAFTGPVSRWRFQGDQTDLTVRFSPGQLEVGALRQAGDTARKVWASLVVLMVGVVVSMSGPRAFCKRWPHFALALGGFGWWLVLRPSGLGLVVMALAFAWSMRLAWRTTFAGRWERGSTRSGPTPLGAA